MLAKIAQNNKEAMTECFVFINEWGKTEQPKGFPEMFNLLLPEMGITAKGQKGSNLRINQKLRGFC